MSTDEQNVWFNATHWCGIIGHGVVKYIMWVLTGMIVGWCTCGIIHVVWDTMMLLCGGD